MSKKNSFDDQLQYIDYELNIEYHGNNKVIFEHEDQHPEYEDMQICDLGEKYLENFQIVDDSEYILYQVEQDDSFFGLELKFNVCAEQLMSLNNISENSLLKGITLKIPKKHQITQQEKDENHHKQLKTQHPEFSAGYIKYFDIFYISSVGCIKGQLTVHDDVIFFDPAFNNQDNERIVQEQKLKSVQQLQFQILLKNVVRVMKREFPSCIKLDSTEIIKSKFIEIHLQSKRSKVVLIQPSNYDQFLELLESINTVYASYFPPTPNQITLSPKKTQLKTILPFYYLNNQQLEDNIQMAFLKNFDSEIYISYLVSDSELINQDIFMKVACYFPTLFKSQKWKKIYSTTSDGSSIRTLMRNTKNSEPVILFIRDLDKYLFGAYLSEGIQKSQDHFYGTGESFLFTFKDNLQLQVYNWINQNNYITLCDDQGLAIGCGDKYGLYIDSELSNGYSHYCETFGNDILSNKENFIIDRIEIWGLQQI